MRKMILFIILNFSYSIRIQLINNTMLILAVQQSDSLTRIHISILVAQMVRNLPEIWETQISSLGQEDSLEEEMATHSSILAWRIPWIEEPGGLQSVGSHRIRHD